MKFRMDRTISFTLLILYALLLVKLILFKGAYFFRVVPTNPDYEYGSRTSALISYNFVPFKTILFYIKSEAPIFEKLFNVFGNILLFIPFGFFLSRVLTAPRFWNICIISFLLSTFFELFQFRTHTGTCDIDDVILNTSGAILGYIILVNLQKLLKGKKSYTLLKDN
ncbi:MAG TPA: VanZ family protein [Flavisolibacter sp.]|nr:VanZ family protein [Flavisolibacter sp.]